MKITQERPPKKKNTQKSTLVERKNVKRTFCQKCVLHVYSII